MAEASTVAETKVVNVQFQKDSLPKPRASLATDAAGSAPRPSRHIDFVDDGKLFEGHLTVQSRSLKSIIQFLVDQHAEQAVIIQDLQDQVSSLRTKVNKANRSGGGFLRGGAGSGASPMEVEELNKRVKRVEGFVSLWGARPEDISELVQTHGDPVVTPEEYTSYLLDLPCFRLTRREARALVATAAANTVVGGTGAGGGFASTAQDTAARRTQSQNNRSSTSVAGDDRPASLLASGGQTSASATSANAHGGDADTARKALHGVTEALQRIEALERRQGGGTEGGVDAQARQDIEDLGEFVTRRLQELESRTMLAGAAAGATRAAAPSTSASQPATFRAASRNLAERRARKASVQMNTHDSKAESADEETAASPAPHSREAKEGHRRGQRSPSPSAPNDPPLPAKAVSTTGSSGPAVDPVAREDAAASLELIEMLESTVEKRFRELATQMANLTVRHGVAVNSNNSSNPASGAAVSATEKSESTSRSGSKQSRGGGGRTRGSGTTGANGGGAPAPASQPTPPPPQPVAPLPPAAVGPVVDQAAREEVATLADRLGDLEDDMGKRWQALEERLRIIGRASMNRAVGPNASGTSVDRKAREDASLSLMRIQQLERELVQLRRQLGALATAASAGGQGSSAAALAAAGLLGGAGGDGPLRAGAGLANLAGPPPENLRDTYTSKINDLEKEVEQRMAEVNRAIAILKEHDETVGSAFAGGGGVPPSLQSALMLTANAGSGTTGPHSNTGNAVAEAPAPPTSTIVLRSSEAEEQPETENPSTPPPPLRLNTKTDTPRTSLSVLQLKSHGAEATSQGVSTPAVVGLPMSSLPHRLTVSRLRRPDAPLFGAHLVVRDAVTDEELEAVLGKQHTAAAAEASAAAVAAVADPTGAADHKDADAVPSPRQDVPDVLGEASTASLGGKATRAAAVPSWTPQRPPVTAPAFADAGTSALGHTTPCVVVDCAWCQRETQTMGGSGGGSTRNNGRKQPTAVQ